MEVLAIVLVVSFIYLASFLIAPFPYWPSYFSVARHVVAEQSISFTERMKLLNHLLKELLRCPVFALFWMLDEIFFSNYKKVSLSAPIFVISQPRSGTTFLFRTLSQDANSFLSLKHLEWRYPFISLWKVIDLFGLRSVIERISYWPNNELGKMARKIHFHQLGSHEEHGIFFEERFYHHYFVFRRFPFPKLLSKVTNFYHIPAKNRQRILSVYKNVVQKAFYYRGSNEIWLTKENESVEVYESMSEMFPDARYICIVREHKDFLDSYLTMSIACTEVKHGIDPKAIEGWYEANLKFREEECRKMIQFCDKIKNTNNLVFITFKQFTGDIPATMKYIYNQLDLPMKDEYMDLLNDLKQKQGKRQRGYNNEICDFNGFEFFDNFVAQIESTNR